MIASAGFLTHRMHTNVENEVVCIAFPSILTVTTNPLSDSLELCDSHTAYSCGYSSGLFRTSEGTRFPFIQTECPDRRHIGTNIRIKDA